MFVVMFVLETLGYFYQAHRGAADSGVFWFAAFDVFGIQAYVERALMKVGIL